MSKYFDPNFWLVELVIALALLLTGYGFGHQNATNACVAKQVVKQEKTQEAVAKEVERKEAVGAAREVSRERIRVVYRVIKEKTDEHISAHSAVAPSRDNVDCGLDADGLRLWNAANSGEVPALPTQSDSSLPASASGEIGEISGLEAQSRGGDGVVRAVPGSTGSAGGMPAGER